MMGSYALKQEIFNIWKYNKFSTKKPLKDIHILHVFEFKKKTKGNYYFYLKSPYTIHNFFKTKWCYLICFNRFTSKIRLMNHLKKCTLPEAIYPDKDSIIEYGKKTAAKYYSLLAITGFADFESKLKPMSHNSTKNNPSIFEKISKSESYTIKCANHELVSYSVIICRFEI